MVVALIPTQIKCTTNNEYFFVVGFINCNKKKKDGLANRTFASEAVILGSISRMVKPMT